MNNFLNLNFYFFKKITLFFLTFSLVFLGFLFSQKIASAEGAVNVNNFSISDYHIDYELSRDENNFSFLKTTETITAKFPDFNQNHGLERALPTTYQNHPLRLEIISVTDEKGKNLNFTTYDDSNKNKIVRIGDANIYVHGLNTYVITYTYENVTHFFEDTNADEFYWNTNGTAWRVPINNLAVTLKISDDLLPNLNNKTACYFGKTGSTNDCELIKNTNTFSTSAKNLQSGENITIAVGFNPETFSTYKASTWEKFLFLYQILQLLFNIIGGIIIVWIYLYLRKKTSRKRELNPIVTEFTPPKDFSVSTSAEITDNIFLKNFAFTAQVIDFAVRGYVRIVETKPESLFKKAEFNIEIIKSIEDLKAEEKEILIDIFQEEAFKIGSTFPTKKLRNNRKLFNRFLDNEPKLNKLIRENYLLQEELTETKKLMRKISLITFILGIVIFSPVMIFAAVLSFIFSYNCLRLTDKGLALKRYVLGLKQYIKVAEAERMKMLQSPEGAEKIKIDTSDTKQLIKLYESVLPYAILFGFEKEWKKSLALYYTDTNSSPSWFVGMSGASFSMSDFSNSFSNFTSSTNSSSGGSGGGGSSGGGGGGGGGGGW